MRKQPAGSLKNDPNGEPSVSSGRHDDDRATTAQNESETRSQSGTDARTRDHADRGASPDETQGFETPHSDELLADGGTEYFAGPEARTARQLRVVIGATYGRDLRERVDNTGNSAAAVAFRRPLLEEIASDILDDVAVKDLSVKQLRAMVARALDHEPPAGHFTWLILRDIYEAVVKPGDLTGLEELDLEYDADVAKSNNSTTAAHPADDTDQTTPEESIIDAINWRRLQ